MTPQELLVRLRAALPEMEAQIRNAQTAYSEQIGAIRACEMLIQNRPPKVEAEEPKPLPDAVMDLAERDE